MTNFSNFFDSILWTTIIAVIITHILKGTIGSLIDKKFDVRKFVGSGGMPSSHSSFSVSLATSIGLTEGFLSSMFAIAFVLAFIIMYDASGVRRAAGKQAEILNRIIENWNHDSIEIKGERLRELLGHTPYEVFAGAALGVVIALLRHY